MVPYALHAFSSFLRVEDFGATVMVPMGTLVDHFQLLTTAQGILDLLRSADCFGTGVDVDDLASRIVTFHNECIRLHGVSIAKIKMHLQHHIPRCVRDHDGVVLSCFSCEARVRFVKQAAYNSSRLPPSQKCRVPLQRLLIQQEESLLKFELGVSIPGKRRADEFVDLLPPHPEPSGAFFGTSIQRPNGRIGALQFAFVEYDSGQRGLCQVLGFIQPCFQFETSSGVVLAIVMSCKQDGRRWTVARDDVITVAHSKVDRSVAVAADGENSVTILNTSVVPQS